jgi:uncharacterized protein
VKVRVPIEELRIGMFVLSEVRTLFLQGEMRHYLEPSEAEYVEPTGKRLRLLKKKFEQVATSGGILLGAQKQIAALDQIGIREVVVETDKSDILPDNMPDNMPAGVTRKPARTAPMPPAESATHWVEDMAKVSDLAFNDAELAVTRRPSASRRVDVAGTERRRNFGPSNSGWMKLEVTETTGEVEPRLCAFLQVLSFGGDAAMTSEDVFHALEEQYGICAGLDEGMVRKLAAQAAASPTRVIRGQFLVASSPRRDPEQVGHIHFTCLQDLPAGTELPFARLRQAFAAEESTDAADVSVQVCTVSPGEELAVFHAAGKGDEPPDIFGNRRAPVGAGALLRHGAHVEPEGDRFLARIYGYLCIVENEISVIPPVWLSPDKMEAYHIALADPRQEAPELRRDELLQILQARGVTHGLRESAIDELLAAPAEGTKATMLAAGSRAVKGNDAAIHYSFGGRDGASFADAAGSHKESLVQEGDMIAEVSAALPGSSGIDVTGIRVEGVQGTEQYLLAGSNVRCEEHEDRQSFFAKVEGSARVHERILRVRPVVHVRGNIDSAFTVKPGTDVYVQGSVRAGGSIEADGTISVEGSVEGGAVLQSQSDVIVAKGIIGHGTRVEAQGDVVARFIQSSSVIAGGDITSTHLMNASVRAHTLVVNEIEGDERAGSIVGGQTQVTMRVEANRAGSPMSETKLSVVADPDIQAQMAKLDKGLNFCRSNILRILRTLGVREIDAVQLRALINKAPPDRRKPLIKVLTQLKQLVDTRDKSVRLHNDLEQEQETLYAEAEICIRELVNTDVRIQIGERVLQTKDDLTSGAVFRRTANGINWMPPEG